MRAGLIVRAQRAIVSRLRPLKLTVSMRRSAHSCALLTLLLCWGTAQTSDQLLTITVHPDDTNCSLHEIDMSCSDVPSFLLQTLHVPLDQRLMVTWKGADPTETLGRKLGALLRDAGFTNVALIGFLTQPDHGVHDMPAPANPRLERP